MSEKGAEKGKKGRTMLLPGFKFRALEFQTIITPLIPIDNAY